MRIIYAGSPQYAVPPLKALAGRGEVIAVITSPDKPVGRRAVMTAPPVKICAEQLGIPVYQFDKIRGHADEIKALGADVMFTCAYGQILTDDVLSAFPLGVYNLHASLLPKFRGASPIQSAILAGEKYTGVTVMKTERELDSGDILLVKRCEAGGKTYGELADELSLLSAAAAEEAAEYLEAGKVQLLMQDKSAATFCRKIQKSDAKINFADSPEKVCRLVNAMNPAPAAWCVKNGAPVNIYRAEPCAYDGVPENGTVAAADKSAGIVVGCGGGFIRILSAQFAGGKQLKAADLINGRKFTAGERLE